MNKTWVILGLIAVLVIVVGVAASATIDQSMALEQRTDELARQRRRAEIIAALFVQLPRSAGVETTVAFLKERYPDAIIKREGDTLHFNDIILQFTGKTNTGVRYYG